MLARLPVPAAVFALCAGVYVATLGSRIDQPTPDRHFVHLADSYLHGQLHVVGNTPPTRNDWAHYNGRWYVSFPPLPALIILPAVAVFGTAVWDRLFWALFAGLGPALVWLMLRRLRTLGHSARTPAEDLWLTGLFAVGTVYYFSSVQGSVWFSAHVVVTVASAGYVIFSLGARRPLLAGACLAAAFLTRPPTLLLGAFFLIEALIAAQQPVRKEQEQGADAGTPVYRVLFPPGAQTDLRALVRSLVLFALPLLAAGVITMALNYARFDHPLSFGHEYLQIRWRPRIDRWGLFNYHYLGRNLAVLLAALPWLSSSAPYVLISRHGLALWVTTPNLSWLLWPRRVGATAIGLTLAASLVALADLLYQNSGWIQFGYRFALDYMVLLFALLAIGGRPFGMGFRLLVVVAVVVNTFGAITFDRMHRFYDDDTTQQVIFQPD